MRQGAEATIHQKPWRYSTGPVCRFQAIDHIPNTTTCDDQISAERTDLETRIERLCSSLQSILEQSRMKERWRRKEHKIESKVKSVPRYFPKPEEWGISEAEMCNHLNINNKPSVF